MVPPCRGGALEYPQQHRAPQSAKLSWTAQLAQQGRACTWTDVCFFDAVLKGGLMRSTIHVAVAVMAALPTLFGPQLYAQKPDPTQAVQPSRDAADVLTVSGCVQPEAEYRSQVGD